MFIDIVGILTRSWLALNAPTTPPPAQPAKPVAVKVTPPAKTVAPVPAQIVSTIPLVGAPGAGSAAAAAPAKAATASAVVTEVQKFYAGINQVTASFRQSVTNNTFGSTKTSDGAVYLMKPGKMRWDYYEKKKQKVTTKKSFISNGSYLYVVEHDNKQVVKKNLANDLMPVAVTFLYGKGDLQAEFTPEIDKTGKYGGKNDVVLKMTPKKSSAQYKNLYLVVDTSNYRVKESIIIDSSNNVNHFMFFKPDFNTPTKDAIYEFDERSVKNYRIVDADAQPAQGSAAGSAAAPTTPAAPAKK